MQRSTHVDWIIKSGFLITFLMCRATLGQYGGNGDFDVDSDVDGDDFGQFGDCMTGPGAEYAGPFAPCSAFDFDADDDVDLLDLGIFQAVFQKPVAAGCDPGQQDFVGSSGDIILISCRGKLVRHEISIMSPELMPQWAGTRGMGKYTCPCGCGQARRVAGPQAWGLTCPRFMYQSL